MRFDFFAAVLGTAIVCSAPAQAQLETVFVYQGSLMEAGEPANGEYEFQLRLLDDLNFQVGTTQFSSAVINEGIFQIDMDFGLGAFDGSTRYLEISVRSFMDGGPYITLSPNQLITSTPVAQFALSGNEGPQGPQGVQGPQGDAGAAGMTGADGSQGIQGESGNDGLPGAEGMQGIQGAQGNPGTPGDSHWTLNGSATYYTTGNVGIGTASPIYPLQVQTNGERAVHASTSSTLGRGIYGEATAASGFTYGGRFLSESTSGRGVFSVANASTGTTYGVYGQSSSTSGRGVYGRAVGSTGTTFGVYGNSSSPSGRGVYGEATASSGDTFGVYGQNSSTSGRGVFGEATATSGSTYGVYGRSSSTSGRGVFGWSFANTGVNSGVQGQSNSTSGRGIFGLATAATGASYGVLGQSDSTSGQGVYGAATADTGETYGVHGLSESLSGLGVYGEVTAVGGTPIGVFGKSSAPFGRGVRGWASAATGTSYGVQGQSDSTNGRALYGSATAGTGVNYGVYASTNSSDGYAGFFSGGKNYFGGNVGIGTSSPTFNLSVSGSAGKTGGGSWAVFSDQRLKKNITSMAGSLDTISALRPVNFEYTAKDHFSYTPGVQSGFIAQEVQGVIPQWVNTADDGYFYLDQVGYEALIVDAIQELRAEKDAEISKKDQQILELQLRLDRIERMMVLIADK